MIPHKDLAHRLSNMLDEIALIREDIQRTHPQTFAHLSRAWNALCDARATIGATPHSLLDSHRNRLEQTANQFLSQQFRLEKLVDLLSTIETEAAHRMMKALHRECVHEHVMKPRKLRAIDCDRCQVVLLELQGS